MRRCAVQIGLHKEKLFGTGCAEELVSRMFNNQDDGHAVTVTMEKGCIAPENTIAPLVGS